MTSKMQTGSSGEHLAADYLISKGYEILKRNYRYRKSEIDIIAKWKDWIVFVEVKSRNTAWFGYPEEFVENRQQQMIFEGASNYLYEIDWQGNVRYDIVSILNKPGEEPEIMHFEDAFY